MRQLAGTHSVAAATAPAVKEGRTVGVAAAPFNLRRKSHWTGAAVGGGGGGGAARWTRARSALGRATPPT